MPITHGRGLAIASESEETIGVRNVLSQKIGNRYSIELYSRPLPLDIGVGGDKGTIPGSLFWLEANDQSTGEKRPVWREWVLTRRAKEWEPRDFTIGRKDDKTVALAFVEGPNIRFWEIRLDTTVDVDPSVAAKQARNTARPLLMTNTPTNIPIPRMVKDGKMDTRLLKIQGITWQDGRWQVRASVGERQISLVRSADSKEWKLSGGK
jgi:hypothetical protein